MKKVFVTGVVCANQDSIPSEEDIKKYMKSKSTVMFFSEDVDVCFKEFEYTMIFLKSGLVIISDLDIWTVTERI